MTDKRRRSKGGARRADTAKGPAEGSGSKRHRGGKAGAPGRQDAKRRRPGVSEAGGSRRGAGGAGGSEGGRTATGAGRRAVSPPRGTHSYKVLAIVAALLLAYAFSLGNDFVYDDRYVIVENEVVTDPGKLTNAFSVQFYTGLDYYRPITLLSFAMEYRLWGADPLGYHVTNLLLLMGVALALYFLLRRLLDPGRGWTACIMALLFALHPAVTSVGMALGARGDLLCILFLLATYLAYTQRGAASYAAAVVFYALALLSKETAVTLPAILLLMEIPDVARPRAEGAQETSWKLKLRRALLRGLPFWIVLAGYLALRRLALPGLSTETAFDPILTLKSYLYLLTTSLAPSVALAYEPFFGDWFSRPRVAIAVAMAVAAIALSSKAGRAARRQAAFWLAWAGVTFLPTSNIVRQETVFDERYTVTPLIGIVAAVGLVVYHAGRAPRSFKTAKLALALALIAAFAGVTIQRGRIWSDDVTFLTQWRRTGPENPRPRHHLGIVLWEMGRKDLARSLFSEAVELDPEYVPSLNMLGLSSAVRGRLDEAIKWYQSAVELDPSFAAAQFNLARAYQEKGDCESALPHYQAAAALDPGWLEAVFGVARCSHDLGMWDKAVISYRRVLEQDEAIAPAYFGLSGVYKEMGATSQAIGLLRQGLKYAPGDTAASSRLDRLLRERASGEP